LAIIAPFPVIVWGADELVRWVRRRAGRHRFPHRPLPQPADRQITGIENVLVR
jgi:hypothetical protein